MSQDNSNKIVIFVIQRYNVYIRITVEEIMEIKVENLGVITEGKIELKKNVVNIKYGINGSGKAQFLKVLNFLLKVKI